MAAPQEQEQHDPGALPSRARAILEFERQWWRHAGAKDESIRAEFGLSAARYYQLLNAVIDEPEALKYDPMLVKRLQRARDARTQARAARTFTSSAQDGNGSRPRDEESTE